MRSQAFHLLISAGLRMGRLSVQIPTLFLCLVRNLSYSAASVLSLWLVCLDKGPWPLSVGHSACAQPVAPAILKQPLGLTQAPQRESPASSPHSRCSDTADSPSQVVRWWRVHLYCQEPSWGKSEEELPNCPRFVFYCFLN